VNRRGVFLAPRCTKGASTACCRRRSRASTRPSWGPTTCSRIVCARAAAGLGGVTALFCGNVWLTIGALRAAGEQALDVPHDLEIVGFDDIVLADLLRFPITTVAQDVETIGHTAFGMPMQIREGQPAPATSLVPPRLVVR
jgi:DNA-binding LacI/PurR family transcriptional regulator